MNIARCHTAGSGRNIANYADLAAKADMRRIIFSKCRISSPVRLNTCGVAGPKAGAGR